MPFINSCRHLSETISSASLINLHPCSSPSIALWREQPGAWAHSWGTADLAPENHGPRLGPPRALLFLVFLVMLMSQLSPSFRPQLYLPCIPYNERLPLTFLLNKWICLVRQKAAASLYCLAEEQLVVCCGTRISSTSWLCHTHQIKEIPASVKVKKLGCLFKQSTLLIATCYLPPVLWNFISLTRAIEPWSPSFYFFFLCSRTIIGRTRKIRLWQNVPSLDNVCGLFWGWLLSCFIYGASCNCCYTQLQ